MTFHPDYVSVEDLAAFLRIPGDDNLDDAQLGLAVTTASAIVNQFTNRQFGQVDAVEERTYEVQYNYERRQYFADIDDLMDLTDSVFELDGVTVADYELRPLNAPQNGKPYTRLLLATSGCELSATALWGWSSVPSAVRNATLLQASRLFNRRNAPFGISGSPEQGGELRLLAKVDPDVQVILAPYRRARMVA